MCIRDRRNRYTYVVGGEEERERERNIFYKIILEMWRINTGTHVTLNRANIHHWGEFENNGI